jgi:RluA family pseudouridine synthase
VPGKSCHYCFKTPEEEMAANITRRHAAIRRTMTPLPGTLPFDNFRPINVPEECDNTTLLDTLGCVVKYLPRTYWEGECAKGLLLSLDRQPVVATKIVRAGERYLHKFPNIVEPDVNVTVEILHEDEALIVLNKPAPLPMHAGGRFHRNTLQYILNHVYHPQKPRPAHRLDANTTGLVLVTRTRHFAARLQPQFARGDVRKIYLARVQGHPREDVFSCNAPISDTAGKLGAREVDLESGLESRTAFRVLQRNGDGTALLEARPLTGRTNQIRIHLWHLGFPICGDQVYLADNKRGDTQTLSVEDAPLCLHAWKISFTHPMSKQAMEFTASAPGWANWPL